MAKRADGELTATEKASTEKMAGEMLSDRLLISPSNSNYRKASLCCAKASHAYPVRTTIHGVGNCLQKDDFLLPD
jgi:hypothetical protein